MKVKAITKQILKTHQIVIDSNGTSMIPLLFPHDKVVIHKVRFSRIAINNIVLVGKKNVMYAHRVIYKHEHYILTKGDNCIRHDGVIYPKHIIGIITCVNREKKMIRLDNLYLMQSSVYFQEIAKIQNACKRMNITMVILKGLPLHLRYQKTHPKRVYIDCDTLISRDDQKKAHNILIELGYKRSDTNLSVGHRLLRGSELVVTYYKITYKIPVVFDFHFETGFMIPQLGALTCFYPAKQMDRFTKQCIQKKQKVFIHNESFFILHPVYLILYLALHLFHHNFRGAFRYELLDKVMRKELKRKCEVGNKRLDEEVRSMINPTSYLNNQASHFNFLTSLIMYYRFNSFVYPVFSLLKKYYKTPIPNSFLASIKPTSHIQRHYLLSIIQHPTSIFDDEPRIKAGINRFKNLFMLSPNPWWRKITILIYPQVIYTGIWLVYNKIRSLRLEVGSWMRKK